MGILPRLQLASVILPFVLALTGCACDGDPGEGPNGQNGETGNITVSIVTPADGGSFSPEEAIQFEGQAVDERTGTEIPNGSLVWSSNLSGQIGIGREVLTALPEGSHTITLTATAEDGVEGTASIALLVEMPAIAITVSIIAPADGESFSPEETIQFEGQAVDERTGTEILNSSLVWSSDLSGQFGIGREVLTALPEGSHTITLTATAEDGVEGTASIALLVEMPAIAITVSIIAPADGETFSSVETIQFEGLAVDERTATEIPNSGLVWSSDLSGQIGIGRDVLTALPEGSHTITLTATADDGVEGTASIALVVEMPAMEVRIVNPRDRDIFLSGQSIEFECQARQDGAAVANAQFRWLDDAAQFGLGAVVQTALLDGSRIITCEATNPLTGVIGEDSIRISVGEPAVRINAPLSSESFDFGQTIEFRAQVITSDPAPHNVVWTSDLDGQLGLGQTVQTALASIGLHSITASFTDAAGETATDTIVIEYVRPNQAPVVVITRPAVDGVELASNVDAIFEGTALDVEDGDLSATATWFDPVVGEFGTGPEATIINPLPGKYEVTLSVVDSGGLPGQDTRIVYVQPADGGPLMEVAFAGNSSTGVSGSENGVWVAWEGAFTHSSAGGDTTLDPIQVALPNGALPVAVATGGGRTAFASDDGLAICTGTPEAFVCSSYRDDFDNELGSTEVLALVVLNDGTVIAAGEGGLFVVDPEGQISVYNGGDWNGDDRVNDLDLDAAGVVWMATDDGLVSFNVAAATFTIHPRGGLPETLLRSVAERDGVVWVGHDQGISQLQTPGGGQQWRSFGAQEGLTQARVLSLDLDSRGVVWGGTDGGGAFRLDPDIGAFLMITPGDGLPGSIVEDTFVDELDVKWFATDGGLGLWYGQ